MEFKRFNNRIWLSSPTMHGEEQRFIQRAFDTNWVSSAGENLDELEKGIREYVGCKASVALSSGTSAIHLALKLAGVSEGDVVFVTDLTFAATVNPIIYERCTPVFIDSERDTWNMNPKALEKALIKYDGKIHEDGKLYPVPKAVVVVNLYGVPAKLDEISAICNRYKVILIEDAAESLGATYKGKQTGTFGQYNAISFNGNKIITTSGGGMLLTDYEDAAAKARKWSTQSRESFPWYEHKELGYNYRMSNIVAGIGRGQIIHLDEHIEKKTHIYMRYKEGLKDFPISMNPYIEGDMKPNYWLSCILIDKDYMCKADRNKIYEYSNKMQSGLTYQSEEGKSCPDEIREFLEKYNVESRPIWKPMHMQPMFMDYDFISVDEDIDIDADIFERGLCLPSDITMSDEEQSIIIDMIRSCF